MSLPPRNSKIFRVSPPGARYFAKLWLWAIPNKYSLTVLFSKLSTTFSMQCQGVIEEFCYDELLKMNYSIFFRTRFCRSSFYRAILCRAIFLKSDILSAILCCAIFLRRYYVMESENSDIEKSKTRGLSIMNEVHNNETVIPRYIVITR
jgi:hypothetical protein